MRFMMLVIPKGYGDAPPGTTPDAEAVAKMMTFNEELQRAGVLLALDGLHPPSMGARVRFRQGKAPVVMDGPFPEVKEVLGGYWMIRVGSKAEAVDWARRCPMPEDADIEIRQVQEMEDFPPDVQQAAAGFDELLQREAGQTGASGAGASGAGASGSRGASGSPGGGSGRSGGTSGKPGPSPRG